MEKIQELKAEHPFWGYRRTWARLTYAYRLQVNKNRYIGSCHGLIVTKNTQLKTKRTTHRSKPQGREAKRLSTLRKKALAK